MSLWLRKIFAEPAPKAETSARTVSSIPEIVCGDNLHHAPDAWANNGGIVGSNIRHSGVLRLECSDATPSGAPLATHALFYHTVTRPRISHHTGVRRVLASSAPLRGTKSTGDSAG